MNAQMPRGSAKDWTQKAPTTIDPRPEHDARALTDGGVEARIVLDGTPYVLRITRLGKLILTK